VQFNRAVIPGEPSECGRDPESRKLVENQNALYLSAIPAGDEGRAALRLCSEQDHHYSIIPPFQLRSEALEELRTDEHRS
jgi:hypothetical protein